MLFNAQTGAGSTSSVADTDTVTGTSRPVGGQIVGLRGERAVRAGEEQVLGDQAIQRGDVGAELRGAELGLQGGDVGVGHRQACRFV